VRLASEGGIWPRTAVVEKNKNNAVVNPYLFKWDLIEMDLLKKR
jgi:hypothetical protein